MTLLSEILGGDSGGYKILRTSVHTTSGSWTKSPDTVFIDVYGLGAGGAGGAHTSYNGTGGQGAPLLKYRLMSSTLLATEAIVIATGSLGDGASSWFGSHAEFIGGKKGGYEYSTNPYVTGPWFDTPCERAGGRRSNVGCNTYTANLATTSTVYSPTDLPLSSNADKYLPVAGIAAGGGSSGGETQEHLKRFLASQTNLVSNGEFTTDTTGWSVNAHASIAAVDGELEVTSSSGLETGVAYQAITTEIGKQYWLEVTKSSQGASGAWWGASTTSDGERDLLNFNVYDQGTEGGVFTAVGTTTYIQLGSRGTGQSTTFDNVSVKEYKDPHVGDMSKLLGGSGGDGGFTTEVESTRYLGGYLANVAYLGMSFCNNHTIVCVYSDNLQLWRGIPGSGTCLFSSGGGDSTQFQDVSISSDGMYFACSDSTYLTIYKLDSPYDLASIMGPPDSNGNVDIIAEPYSQVHEDFFDGASNTSIIAGFDFKGDGTKLYLAQHSGGEIWEYDLSVPWNLSTLTKTDEYTYSAGTNSQQAINIVDDGTVITRHDQDNNRTAKITMSTPWDLTTASTSYMTQLSGKFMYTSDTRGLYYHANSACREYSCTDYGTTLTLLNTHTYEHAIRSVHMSSDERNIIAFDENRGDIIAYYLTEAGQMNDFATIFARGLDELTPYNGYHGLTLSPDGSKMFIATGVNDHWSNVSTYVTQVDLTTPWRIETFTNATTITLGNYSGIEGLHWNSDGTRLYWIYNNSSNDTTVRLYSREVTTPYDISTFTGSATYTQHTLPSAGYRSNSFISPDGLEVVGKNHLMVLSTPYDLSTVQQTFPMSGLVGNFVSNSSTRFIRQLNITNDQVTNMDLCNVGRPNSIRPSNGQDGGFPAGGGGGAMYDTVPSESAGRGGDGAILIVEWG